ncbi:MAG: hypothetical protein RIS94_2241 [Pseudomonadota bacterium]|jgi:MFS family permease
MAGEPEATPDERGATPYSWYVLGVLVLVYMLNFIDRQLLTILAADIKRDRGISDADFGFLYGTAFGVFYALFGIPLGKLADRWVRTRLLAIGLAVWSAMTVFSGLAQNFGQLGAARIGVGVGEATAGPCGYSLLADYFPARRRATAVAIFSAGIYLGGGLSLFLGTATAQWWNAAFPAGARPLGLAGWQAAFLAVGVPGLLLALWVRRLREPARESVAAPGKGGWGTFLRDCEAIVPPFTLVAAARRGTVGLVANIAVLAGVAATAGGLTVTLGDAAQWIALGTGVYAVASWAMNLRHDDPEAFRIIWRTPSVLGVNLGYGLLCAVTYSSSAFGPLYAMETLGAPARSVALFVGGGAAAGGALGVVAGGMLGDRVARHGRHSRRILVIIAAVLLSLIPMAVLLTTGSVDVLYICVFPMWFVLSMALGSASGTIVNIVPARVRGTATAAFLLFATMVGLALGPYAAGRLSRELGSLRLGLALVLVVVPPALIALAAAWRHLARQER